MANDTALYSQSDVTHSATTDPEDYIYELFWAAIDGFPEDLQEGAATLLAESSTALCLVRELQEKGLAALLPDAGEEEGN